MLAGVMVISCEGPGEEIKIPTGPAPTVEFLVEKGWAAYEARDYGDADSLFTMAINRDVFYKEAYLGLGWTLNRLSEYNNALPNFDLLLTLVTESDQELRLLSYAGKALSYAGLNADSLSCIQAELFLNIVDAGYVFEHDSRISVPNVKKLLLNGYWNYQDYYGVQNTIINHFDQNWFSDLIVSNDNLREISDVGASIVVGIEVDTSVVPNDTTIASAVVDVPEEYNLLEVEAVTGSLGANIVFPVKRFIHGGERIYVDFKAMKDTSMLLDDLTQAAEVDFVSSEDHGKYLNTLMLTIQLLRSRF